MRHIAETAPAIVDAQADESRANDSVPEPEVQQTFATSPYEVISWGKGRDFEDFLLVWPIDPSVEDEYMTETAVNVSVLHKRIQDVLLRSEAFLTEGKYGACQAGLNWLAGMMYVVTSLKYLNETESKPYYDKLKAMREQAMLYEENAV